MKKKNMISDKVYLELHSKIMNLNIKPGKIISIKDICNSMNISRSPVRDAIIRLEEEGLVESIPQVGIRITQINFKKMEDERYLRHCIEYKMAIDYGSKNYSLIELLKFENNIKLQELAIKEKNYIAFLEYDDAFHEVLFEITGRGFIWEIILENQAHYRRMRLLALISLGDNHLKDLVEQHKKMVEYIKSKDTDSLIKLLDLHISELVEEKFWLRDNYPELIYSDEEYEKKDNSLLKENFYIDLIKKKKE
ncbi:MAG: GntR family transcriptional regulator [Miniphocaeibacter sp.]|uniref:GntR family transcriptional regulator n=1 Tax=Miniphocaeibacter sp. TaxID=3100973 RepID=UPI0017A90ADD|nr:GntR family transcriptional regulator [Gallicola sp.]